ncbi:unnamed protein product [Heterotrigona itama]|uniref:Peptidase A2 domain-containing protein n=1 Tax=Heterotrigona itama TaxID=395501 RepID=A0A6V7H2A7_9HYME|nr:unnamed protein product [Heterotrigona itama]
MLQKRVKQFVFGKHLPPPVERRATTGGKTAKHAGEIAKHAGETAKHAGETEKHTGETINGTKRNPDGRAKPRVTSLSSPTELLIPRVQLESPQLARVTEFLLDTGADLALKGISNERVETLGSTQIYIAGKPVDFHVVPDTLAIKTEGLLGSSFCSAGTVISYPEQNIIWGDVTIPFSQLTVTIPARAVS